MSKPTILSVEKGGASTEIGVIQTNAQPEPAGSWAGAGDISLAVSPTPPGTSVANGPKPVEYAGPGAEVNWNGHQRPGNLLVRTALDLIVDSFRLSNGVEMAGHVISALDAWNRGKSGNFKAPFKVIERPWVTFPGLADQYNEQYKGDLVLFCEARPKKYPLCLYVLTGIKSVDSLGAKNCDILEIFFIDAPNGKPAAIRLDSDGIAKLKGLGKAW